MERQNGITYIDLGMKSTCLECGSRYCTCRERQIGNWENNLPIILVTYETLKILRREE